MPRCRRAVQLGSAFPCLLFPCVFASVVWRSSSHLWNSIMKEFLDVHVASDLIGGGWWMGYMRARRQWIVTEDYCNLQSRNPNIIRAFRLPLLL
jgi:hypothetical protein